MGLLCPNQGEKAKKGDMEGGWLHSTDGGLVVYEQFLGFN
jgi:hypothetical protein